MSINSDPHGTGDGVLTLIRYRTSSNSSAMIQDYLHSEATIAGRIAMGGSATTSQVTAKDVNQASRKTAIRAVKDFENKWERAVTD